MLHKPEETRKERRSGQIIANERWRANARGIDNLFRHLQSDLATLQRANVKPALQSVKASGLVMSPSTVPGAGGCPRFPLSPLWGLDRWPTRATSSPD